MTKKEHTEDEKPSEILVENDALGEAEPELIKMTDITKIQELEAIIVSLKQENAEMNDKMLREIAETQNFRKRLEREKVDIQKYAITKIAKELLNVLDNLGRAQESVPEDQKDSSDLIKNLLTGVEATEKELLRIFDQFKITQFKNLGEKFNPNIHRVMFEQEDDSKEAGTIMQVAQAGYMIEDRLLREALVGVSKRSQDAKKIDEKA